MDEIVKTAVEPTVPEAAAEQPAEAAAVPADPPAAAQPNEAGAAREKAQPEAAEPAEKPAEEKPAAEKSAEEKPAEEPAPDIGALTQRLAQAEIRAAAAAAGVPANKLPYVAKLCDASALCAKDADMTALAAEQVAKVLADLPELGAAAAVGSLGDHRRLPAQSEESRIAEAFAMNL